MATAKLTRMPSKGWSAREINSIFLFSKRRTCWKPLQNHSKISGGTKLRFLDQCSERCMNWNDYRQSAPGSMSPFLLLSTWT